MKEIIVLSKKCIIWYGNGNNKTSHDLHFLHILPIRLFDNFSQWLLMILICISGTEMDFVENKLSAEFVFNNPNIKGTCGCGESFSI